MAIETSNALIIKQYSFFSNCSRSHLDESFGEAKALGLDDEEGALYYWARAVSGPIRDGERLGAT
jgi:hypothetical protein